jgi:hypothetical protein
MSALAELTDTLIASGMTPGAAAALVARAGVELAGKPSRSRGGDRMENYRDRREAMGLPRIFPAKLYQSPLEERDGRQCIYCRDTDNLVVDHIEPLFKGGTDDLRNLGFACRSCNGGKAGKSLADTDMQIVVESAHIAHTSYLGSRGETVNCARTTAHTSEHVRGPYLSSSTISQKDSVKEEERLEAPRPKKASRLPADWQLEQRHIDYAISKGVTRERVPILGEKFKNHWWASTGKGSTSPNWFLKWCTWVMNEVEWNGTNGSKSRHDRTAQTPRNGAAGQDAILAGMGRLAARVAERGASERRDREVSDDDDAPAGYDARLV